MSLEVSRRSLEIVQSEIRSMHIECERIGGINLSQGVCDTEVPLPVRIGAQAAIEKGINSYTRYDGLEALRLAIAKKMSSFNGIIANPETEIVVSSGSTGAFFCTCFALLNPGDEVLLFEPYYGYHINTLLAVGAVPRYIRLEPPHWSFSISEIENKITAKTKAIVINTPMNPAGKVFSKDEIESIADIAVSHDLFILTDEIYEYFVYDGKKHLSPGSLQKIQDRTITISGYSKTFSITGWRIGYSVSSPKWAKMIGFLNDLIYVCAPAPLQIGVANGIEELQPEYYTKLCKHYSTKRDKFCAALSKAGMTPIIPQGAYYVLADISHLPGKTSKDKSLYILNTIGIAGVPDSAFYAEAPEKNLIRFCFAKEDNILDEVCHRLNRFCF